ncbi:hypothetical protein T06_16645 [Trichinella sp. T6]|nr:hypothetical protein T06_16645 [Trichinella sp. T6]
MQVQMALHGFIKTNTSVKNYVKEKSLSVKVEPLYHKMHETKQLTDLIKKDRIVEAVRLLDNMLKKNFIFGEHVLVTSGVQSRMTWFLSALTNCIVQLRSDQDVDKLLLISDVIEHMCQQCDVHENSIREKMSKMYLQMSCNLVKMQKCDIAYKFSVYAICTSPDYTLDEYWKRCLMTRIPTSGRNDMTEELKKPVTSFLKSSTFSNWVSIPKLLLLELEWCKRYRFIILVYNRGSQSGRYRPLGVDELRDRI